MSVLARGHDAFTVVDDDVGYSTLIEHRIQTGNSPPVREKARPIAYARRNFLERELDRPQRLGILSGAKQGECPWPIRE